MRGSASGPDFAVAMDRMRQSRRRSQSSHSAKCSPAKWSQVQGGIWEKTIREELDLARRYLAIEEVRFGARLQVQWDVDPQVHATLKRLLG